MGVYAPSGDGAFVPRPVVQRDLRIFRHCGTGLPPCPAGDSGAGTHRALTRQTPVCDICDEGAPGCGREYNSDAANLRQQAVQGFAYAAEPQAIEVLSRAGGG